MTDKPIMSFVLGSTQHGAMIFSRFDFAQTTGGLGYGVGAEMMQREAYRSQEAAQLKALLDVRRKHYGDGVVMLDCGANVGVFTVECARHMRPWQGQWGKVIAWEPQERLYYALCGNIALNNVLNARANWAALGKGTGTIDVPDVDYQQPGSFGSLELDGPNDDLGQDLTGRLLLRTPMSAIDSYGFERVDLIKIDVEGMERDVIEGAGNTIARCKPMLWIEISKTHIQYVISAMDALGYECHPVGPNLLAVPRDAPYVVHTPAPAMEEAVRTGEAGDTEKALAIVNKALADNEDDVIARYNRATLLMQLGRFDDAIKAYRMIISAAQGGHVVAREMEQTAQFGEGFSHLMLGNYRDGFKGFEHRAKAPVPDFLEKLPQLDKPSMVTTNASGLNAYVRGKTILVVGEMGMGDNIMFSRYLPMLAQAGAHVVVSVPPQLGPLFHRLESVQVHTEHSPMPDLWCRIMSLGYLFRTDRDSVPPPAEFHLDETRIARWRAPMMMHSAPGRLRVGLCWSGSRKNRYDKRRSIPLAALSPLLGVPGVDFYSIQMDVRADDRKAFDDSAIFDMAGKFNSFEDTACAMRNLDLVISVDTSVAHLAGTLGVPTLLLLSQFRTYWPWAQDECKWYPSITMFRQSVDGEWGDMVERAADALMYAQIAHAAASGRQLDGRGVPLPF